MKAKPSISPIHVRDSEPPTPSPAVRWPARSLALTLLISLTVLAQASKFNFQTVIFPGDNFTQLLGINDEERIVGYHNATNFQGFPFTLTNNFKLENVPGAAQT
jgi:hypothetical protein